MECEKLEVKQTFNATNTTPGSNPYNADPLTKTPNSCGAKITTSKDLLYVNPNKINKELLINNNNNNKISTISSSKPKTFKMPTSSVLDRVRNFLPELASANQQLSDISPEEKENLNIENVDNDAKVIEMNISMVDPDLLLSDCDEDDDSDSDSEDEKEVKTIDEKVKTPLVIEEVDT